MELSLSPTLLPKFNFPILESDAFVPTFDFPITEAEAEAEADVAPKVTGSRTDFFLTTNFPDVVDPDALPDAGCLLFEFDEPNSFEIVGENRLSFAVITCES